MSDRMEQGSWRNLAGGVLTLCLTLTGCGGGAEPPDNYGIGSDALPALTKLVALGSEMTCSVQENTQAGGDQDTDEAQGQPTYEYSGLESGNQVAAEYVQMLEDNYDCSILGSRDAPKEEPDFEGGGDGRNKVCRRGRNLCPGDQMADTVLFYHACSAGRGGRGGRVPYS